MARNDSADSEFDPEMERVLRQHFDSESADLRSPGDPWTWLESRMEDPAPPPFFSRLLGFLNPLQQGRLSPAFAVAGVAVVAMVITVAIVSLSGNGGQSSDGQMAVVQESESRPAGATAAPFATPRAAVTLAPRAAAERAERDTEAEAMAEASDSSPAPTSTAAPAAATTAPAPTTAAMAMEEAEAEEAPATAAQATAVPRPEPTQVLTSMAATTQAATAAATPAPVPATDAAAMAAVHNPEAESPQAMMPMMPSEATGPAVAQAPAGSAGTAPPGTTFRDYQRQPVVAALEDNVSTFSLDTDRTSFHLALAWANAGHVIDPDSVRSEEWLNAFDYRYDPPAREDEFAIVADLFPHPLDEGKRLARIGFQAPVLVDDRPLNVTLVLDASGSMADGNRVDIARAAAESIRRGLRPNDRIAVVHFTQDVLGQYTVEHTHPNDEEVVRSIAWLRPHGSTNVQAGLNLGVQLAHEARKERPEAYNYVILMSDGVANVDATDPFAILETAYDPDARNPLRLVSIGVGINNYNDVLLEQLAQHGNGWYRYLDSTAQAQATFARENWLALSIPFADQTRAQVTWNTETVRQWRIIGYENRVTADENFAQNRREFAEIHSGASATVLYELELAESALSGPWADLGTVELRWVDPATGEDRSQATAMSGNSRARFSGRDGELAHFGVIVALAADLYGGLTGGPEGAQADVHRDLSILQAQLGSLRRQLGGLDAYDDFAFLLDHLAASVEDRQPEPTRSGYSR